ncbi:MAG: hypothetical protein ACREDA_00765 [Methylocella sp.]
MNVKLQYRLGARNVRSMNVKNPIFVALLVALVLIYPYADRVRLVQYLEARGYSDLQLDHFTLTYCPDRWGAFSYRARLPNGTPVHGGACISYFITETTEPIGKKQPARG